MSATLSNPDTAISEQECQAMRALDRDDTYSRSEIAFLFECGEDTVARHCDRECRHNAATNTSNPSAEYSDEDLLAAYRRVYDRQPYERMSQGVYENFADGDDPAASTIHARFGGWREARAAAWGDDDD